MSLQSFAWARIWLTLHQLHTSYRLRDCVFCCTFDMSMSSRVSFSQDLTVLKFLSVSVIHMSPLVCPLRESRDLTHSFLSDWLMITNSFELSATG